MSTTLVNPDGVPVLGNTSTLFVPAVTITAPKLATELEVAGSLNLTLILLAANYNPNQDVSRGTPGRRLGQTKNVERFTTTTQKLDDFRYIVQPQAAAASDGKKAMETLVEGLQGYIVERLGLPIATPWAVGQFVNIIPITLGPQLIAGDTDDNGEYTVMQPVSVRAARKDNVAIVT